MDPCAITLIRNNTPLEEALQAELERLTHRLDYAFSVQIVSEQHPSAVPLPTIEFCEHQISGVEAIKLFIDTHLE